MRAATKKLLNEIVSKGHYPTHEEAIHAAVEAVHSHMVRGERITSSREVARGAGDNEEIVEHEGKAWYVLGSGPVPENIAQLLKQAVPGAEVRCDALGEWSIWHPSASRRGYDGIVVAVTIDFGE